MEPTKHDQDYSRDGAHLDGCDEYARLSRRGFLGGKSALAAAAATVPAWLPKIAYGASSRGGRDALVTIFLRGAMDGLTAVVPYGDGELYNLRPTLAVPPPGGAGTAVDLDGFFGLAPTAAPLMTPWNEGKLAVVHASGSTDPTRSHFDAMKFMETATPNFGATTITSGWVGRHLQTIAPLASGELRGFGTNTILPRMYAEGPGVLPIPDPGSFAFPGNPLTAAERRQVIADMHVDSIQPLAGAAVSSLATIDLLATIDYDNYVPSNGAVYPTSPFGAALSSIAATLKAGVGVEVAHYDYGGWDHHNQMGPIDGLLAGMLDDLSRGLEAFYLDMKGDPHLYTLALQSEFGRRAAENGSAGADHGHGNVTLAMGENVNGGSVFGTWPGLTNLDNGDVAITTDYRDVIGEILAVRLGSTSLDHVFPNHTPSFLGIVS